MIDRMHKERSFRALFISLIVHLCLLIASVFVLYRQQKEPFEELVSVEFVNEKDLPKPRRKLLKLPPAKRLHVPRQIQSSIVNQPQIVRLKTSANPLNETIHPSERLLLHSATADQMNPQDNLPDVMTAPRQLRSREIQISEDASSRFQTSDGEGVKSYRQRVGGNGSDGLSMFESTGTADIGIVGDRREAPGTGLDGSITGDSPFAHALREIADHIIATREKDKINVVFVLDTSASMQDNIQHAADHLYSMTDAYDEINLEYHLGMLEFSVRHDGQEVKMRSLMPDVGMLRRRMKMIHLSGDEYALDALLATLNYIEFHSDAEKHLVLVTDEPATTSLKRKNALREMHEKVLNTYKLEGVHINILGHTEAFQRRLAEQTGGLWQEIPGGLVQSASLPASRFPNENLLSSFREIVIDIRQNAGVLLFSLGLESQTGLDDHGDILTNRLHREFKKKGIRLSEGTTTLVRQEGSLWVITDNANEQVYTIRKQGEKLDVYLGVHPNTRVEPRADIVIMLDYSRSMGGKSQAIMLGISELIGKLEALPIKYRIGLIRFAEAKDAIKSIDGTVVTKMPINEAVIKRLMGFPFGGDEHLIDAIAEGLPQVKFRRDASRFLLVLTDEPSTGSAPPERAIEICQSLGLRTYVIGGGNDSSDFQSILVQETGGRFFPMPNSLPKTYPYQ